MSDKPILVLGLGNDLLKDDAVGLHVAEKLQTLLGEGPAIEVRSTSLFGLALLDELLGREKVLLIDSYLADGDKRDDIQVWDLQEAGSPQAPCPHFVGLAEIREVIRTLGLGPPQEVLILAIPVSDPFTFSLQMTPEVSARVDEAVHRAIEIIRHWTPEYERESEQCA